MQRFFLSLAAAWFLLACVAPANAEPGETFLIHVTSPLTKYTARTRSIPFLALDALERGHKAAVLFDDEGVKAVKLGAWYGGDTSPLDKTRLPEPDREALAARLRVPVKSIPDNYGDLLRFLKGRGLELFVSKETLAFHGIGEDKYDHAAEPIDLRTIMELLEKAEVYVAY
jgi:hypothetical protein